jgi:hypothetical protein
LTTNNCLLTPPTLSTRSMKPEPSSSRVKLLICQLQCKLRSSEQCELVNLTLTSLLAQMKQIYSLQFWSRTMRFCWTE